MEKPKLFDYLNSIFLKNKIDDLSAYSPFIINRFLSMDKELLPFAFFVNFNSPFWTKELQYEFLFYAIPKKKRFIKYVKNKGKKLEKLKIIQDWFKINEEEAKEYLKILNDKQIKEIEKILKSKKR